MKKRADIIEKLLIWGQTFAKFWHFDTKTWKDFQCKNIVVKFGKIKSKWFLALFDDFWPKIRSNWVGGGAAKSVIVHPDY